MAKGIHLQQKLTGAPDKTVFGSWNTGGGLMADLGEQNKHCKGGGR
jgi:hypothetical protein